MTRRRVLPWLLTGFLSSAAFQACGANSTGSGDGDGIGSAGSGGNPLGDGMVVDAPPGSGAGGESPYDPLCGVTDDSCVPDLTEGDRSCMPTTAGAPAGVGGSGTGGSAAGRAGAGGTATSGSGGTLAESGAGGEGGQSGQGEAGHGGMAGAATGEGGWSEAGTTGEPGGTGNEGGEAGALAQSGGESSGGQPSAGSGDEPSVSGDAGAPAGMSGKNGGSTSGGGAGGSGGGTLTISRSCQVELVGAEPRARCAPSGRGTTGAGCFSTADCAPGLACVGETSPGQCRPYCCTGDSACNSGGTHCDAEQRLVGTMGAPKVPVCMPATGCNLADEYPCPDAGACSCLPGTACMVVTDDGKTSCVPELLLEGKGEAGEACPCAWGHVCSEATNRCVRLCQTAAPGDVCGGARCQFAAGLPPSWGICLTTNADAG